MKKKRNKARDIDSGSIHITHDSTRTHLKCNNTLVIIFFRLKKTQQNPNQNQPTHQPTKKPQTPTNLKQSLYPTGKRNKVALMII